MNGYNPYNPNTNYDTIPTSLPAPEPGLYLAEVVGYQDTNYMGVLDVKLQRYVGNDVVWGQVISVKYMTPFYGVTKQEGTSKNDDYDSTQKSYGMWFVPPDIGTTVIVAVVSSDLKYAYWIGCVPEDGMNFMVPGIASTRYNVDGETERVPVAEYNRKVNAGSQPDPTKIKKPKHPFSETLTTQGLINDDVRGITTSSARREIPSSVFGISTPGPVDKAGPTAQVGKKNTTVNIPISRLGGTTFVMDDGDDKFLRELPAGEGPPVYARIEQSEQSGDKKLPHNELVRIRTRTGHQILLHNSEDLIYIGNAKGTTWIELTSNGKIDIYAKDSISIHTENDLNIKADRDINLDAGRDFNVKATNNIHFEAGADTEIISTTDTKITSGGDSNILSTGMHKETASKIYMNSSEKAVAAIPLVTSTVPAESGTVTTIMKRVPMQEPWAHHENLDPLSFLPAGTDRTSGGTIETPTAYKQYTILNDTFDKFLPPEPAPGDQA
jgi:hypothetical protein